MQRRHGPRAPAATLAALVLGAALATPAAAVAGTFAHDDPAMDAQKITETPTGTMITRAPDNKTGDIVHLGARYGVQRLKETVRLRAMAGRWVLSSRITAGNRHFDLVLRHRPGTNHVGLTRGKDQTAVVCDGLVADVSRPHHRVSVIVPAECLLTPPSLQIGVGIVARGQAKGVSYGDDALRTRGITEARLTLSPEIPQN